MIKKIPDRRTMAVDLASALRDRILTGALTPGEPLREVHLADDFGVSRHTVRAALAQLASERLVKDQPYSGMRVADLGDEALIALQGLRCALESEAVRILREKHGNQWPDHVIAELESALDAMLQASVEEREGWAEMERAHSRFHTVVVEASGSPRIIEVYRQLEAEVQLFMLHLRPLYGPNMLVSDHVQYLADIQLIGAESVHKHLESLTEMVIAARESEARQGQ